MPVKVKAKQEFSAGEYFFAGADKNDIRCYCRVTHANRSAYVINGAYEVILDPVKRTMRIASSDMEFPILLTGKPGIPDLKDYDAAIKWAEEKLK